MNHSMHMVDYWTQIMAKAGQTSAFAWAKSNAMEYARACGLIRQSPQG